MIYVIMCGGQYPEFSRHKSLIEVNNEKLISRTVRLLRKFIKETDRIVITTQDIRFNQYADVILTESNYSGSSKELKGYWLDAFYLGFEDTDKVTYLMGDVYYTENALQLIVECQKDGNILFGTSLAKNEFHHNWGEAFAYVVNDYKEFREGVIAVKKLQDEGRTNRVALVWELYRYLNNFDINTQRINDLTYVCIDDITMDIDSLEDVKLIEKKINEV